MSQFRRFIFGGPAPFFLLLVVALTVVAGSSCSRGAASDAAAAGAAGGRSGGPGGARGGGGGAVVVTTGTVAQKPMAVDVRTVGNVEASSSVEIRSQVAGTLLSVGFNEGQEVTAGQVLFTIDPKQFDVAVRQAEAALAR